MENSRNHYVPLSPGVVDDVVPNWKSSEARLDLVAPGEDSCNKQLREIDLLLRSAPIEEKVSGDEGQVAEKDKTGRTRQEAGENQKPDTYRLLPSIPVDLLFDNHAVELEECRRWANSDAGQVAHMENPAGFANVRAHAEAHLRAIGLAYANAPGKGGPASNSPNSGNTSSSSIESESN